MYWKLNRIQFPVYNLGPGKRMGVWVQGCKLACKGCISPELWNENGGKNIDVELLATAILKVKNTFDGITVTGGEPFGQYEALVAFCSFIKIRSSLDILVYSGFGYDELIEKFPDKLFTLSMDFLIDGRYVQDLAETDNIRGSSNQNFFTFDGGNPIKVHGPMNSGKWSLAMSENDEVFMAGVPKKEDIKSLKRHLDESGIKFEI